MPIAQTDSVNGIKLVNSEDGLVVIQINNTSRFNLYLCSNETNQSFQDRSITVPPNTSWPLNGTTLWLGDLYVWADAKTSFAFIKSLAISKKGVFH